MKYVSIFIMLFSILPQTFMRNDFILNKGEFIVEKYIEAIGGKPKIDKIITLYTESNEDQRLIKTLIQKSENIRIEYHENDKVSIAIANNSKGLLCTGKETSIMGVDMLKNYKNRFNIFKLSKYKEENWSFKFISENDRVAVVKGKINGFKYEFSFNKETHLIDKIDFGNNSIIEFHEYTEINGVRLATKYTQSFQDYKVFTEVTQTQINPIYSKKMFKFGKICKPLL